MTAQRRERERLIDHVVTLTQEALGLPLSRASSYRREQINWELVRHFGRIADLVDVEEKKKLHVVAEMWQAVETHVDDPSARECIKQAWLSIRTS